MHVHTQVGISVQLSYYKASNAQFGVKSMTIYKVCLGLVSACHNVVLLYVSYAYLVYKFYSSERSTNTLINPRSLTADDVAQMECIFGPVVAACLGSVSFFR